MDTRGIQTVIFDLGGVIIDLDIQATLQQLALLSGRPLPDFSSFYHTPEFYAYETGRMSDQGFRQLIRSHALNQVTDEAIDEAWNAMLMDLPERRMQLVAQLSSRFRLMVLSNTNGIHVSKFNQMLHQSTGHSSLDAYFDVVYFSHEIKVRKPDREIYQFVLEENDLKPSETLFLDDNMNNLDAAATLGIQTQHITNPDDILELF